MRGGSRWIFLWFLLHDLVLMINGCDGSQGVLCSKIDMYVLCIFKFTIQLCIIAPNKNFRKVTICCIHVYLIHNSVQQLCTHVFSRGDRR